MKRNPRRGRAAVAICWWIRSAFRRCRFIRSWAISCRCRCRIFRTRVCNAIIYRKSCKSGFRRPSRRRRCAPVRATQLQAAVNQVKFPGWRLRLIRATQLQTAVNRVKFPGWRVRLIRATQLQTAANRVKSPGWRLRLSALLNRRRL